MRRSRSILCGGDDGPPGDTALFCAEGGLAGRGEAEPFVRGVRPLRSAGATKSVGLRATVRGNCRSLRPLKKARGLSG
jgi:hypothetical protein